ncbi:hypothetical protein WJX77_008264 [Trebouxia sp. C0004]
MLRCTRLPHLADARPAALVPPCDEETNKALLTHAENELSAFEASSRRRKAVNNKLVGLGTESCWPHGCGRRPISEPSVTSTHTLSASVTSNSLTWASDSTVAAVLRTRTAQGLRPSMTPSMLSTIGSSTSLQDLSQFQVPGHMSAVPVSWQELVASSRRAQASPNPANRTLLPADALLTGKQPLASVQAGTEEHLLQSFLSSQIVLLCSLHSPISVTLMLWNGCQQKQKGCEAHSFPDTLYCTLRGKHRLPEAELQRLYRVVHIYSLGFHQVIEEITLHAMERRQLLCSVWKAFSQLWEDALQVSFAPEIRELVQERDRLLGACIAAQDAAAEMQQQNRELHDRLRSLVGGAITRMAREKACKGHMASLESQLHLLQDKEAQMKAEKQAQLACQSMLAGSSQDKHEQPKAAQKQAAPENARKVMPKELQQAEENTFPAGKQLQCRKAILVQARIQEKQVLLRQAYKQSTIAEAKCKQLQQQLDEALERCLGAESARDDNSAKLVAANTELKARRTAHDLLHTDWLASQQDLKAHRRVLARLDAMSSDVKKVQSEHAAMQKQLMQANAKAQAAEAQCLELEQQNQRQHQQKQQLVAACQPVFVWAINLTSSKVPQREASDASALSDQQLPADMYAALEINRAVPLRRLSAQPEAVLCEFSDTHAQSFKTKSVPSECNDWLSSPSTAAHDMQPWQRSSSQSAKTVKVPLGAAEQSAVSAVACKSTAAKDTTAVSLSHAGLGPSAVLHPVGQTTGLTSAGAGSVHGMQDVNETNSQAMAGSINSLLQALAAALAAASSVDPDDGDERSSISNT